MILILTISLMVSKRIEFLDLELSSRQRNLISKDEHKFVCSFTSNFKHLMDTLNPDLEICNTMIDLIISLGQSLGSSQQITQRLLQDLLDNNRQKNVEIKEIKNLLQIALDLRKELPTRTDIIALGRSLDLYKPKPIELEIRTILDQTKKEIGIIEELALRQKDFLEELKTFVSN